MGKNKTAASEAAGVQNQFLDKALSTLQEQFGITQENLQPFISAGTEALGGVTQGTTAGGLDARLAEIFNTDIFGSLVDERTRAVQGQLGAGGLTRSGTAQQEIANVPTDIGLQIENLLSGRQSALAGTGLNAATGLGQFGAQFAGNQAGIQGQQGQNIGSGIIGDAQAAAAGFGNILGIGSKILSSLPFSDPRLKENVVKITEVGDLNIYQWDWAPFTKGTSIADGHTLGFMADEVEEKYPEFVGEYCTWKFIDYAGLNKRLREKFMIPIEPEIVVH